MSRLYVVATPIGNLGDISPRALETLRNVALIVAEDTRVTMKLLNHFGIRAKLVASHRHNEENVADRIIASMLESGTDAALVTDAGTPCISDPGWALVDGCIRAGIGVTAVPGPCALAAAVSVSGFDVTQFTFYGFPPREKKPLREFLQSVRASARCAVLYESPFRVKNLVAMIGEVMPEAMLSVSCDLTKLHELTLRGTADAVLEALSSNDKSEKGEYCIVMDLSMIPADNSPEPECPAEGWIFAEMLGGKTLSQARESLQERIGKNQAYAAALRVKKYLESI